MEDNDIYVNPKYIFGHNRKSNIEFYSTVSVEKLLLKNKDVLAAGIIDHTVTDYAFHDKGPEDLYIRASAWWIAHFGGTYKDGHTGDCTKLPASCSLCMLESLYTDGLSNILCFDELISKLDEDSKNKLSGYNSCILFMTICQLQEEYWREFSDYCKEYYTIEDNKPPCNFTKDCSSYKELLQKFLNMTEEEQLEKYNRMKLVREYIENPTKIEGIPWW